MCGGIEVVLGVILGALLSTLYRMIFGRVMAPYLRWYSNRLLIRVSRVRIPPGSPFSNLYHGR